MFGFLKKKKEETVEVTIPASTSIEETMGMKEYVSFDSVKAHLVNILEENRRLKGEAEERRNKAYEIQQEERKQKELALIEADEWKKRAKEKDEEIRRLENIIDEQDKQIEELNQEQNDLKTAAEMAQARVESIQERYRDKEDCALWLKRRLKEYCGYEWERIPKTQLVSVLKKILEESEKAAGRGGNDEV